MLVQFNIAVTSQKEPHFTPQLVAIFLMQRLHVICVQLFLAIIQMIGEEAADNEPSESPSSPSEESRQIRRLAEIEAKMLRLITSHTSPTLEKQSNPSELRRTRRSHPTSCPPSPKLFAIDEESS